MDVIKTIDVMHRAICVIKTSRNVAMIVDGCMNVYIAVDKIGRVKPLAERVADLESKLQAKQKESL